MLIWWKTSTTMWIIFNIRINFTTRFVFLLFFYNLLMQLIQKGAITKAIPGNKIIYKKSALKENKKPQDTKSKTHRVEINQTKKRVKVNDKQQTSKRQSPIQKRTNVKLRPSQTKSHKSKSPSPEKDLSCLNPEQSQNPEEVSHYPLKHRNARTWVMIPCLNPTMKSLSIASTK